MFLNDWLKKIQDEYGTHDDIHIDNYQRLLNHLRATDNDTPNLMTASLLKRLLSGENVREISRIIGVAVTYNRLLDLFNIYDSESRKLKKEIGNPAITDEEKTAMKEKWQIAWEKRESYWVSMEIVNVPLTQVCFDIEEGKYLWYVDVDRIC